MTKFSFTRISTLQWLLGFVLTFTSWQSFADPAMHTHKDHESQNVYDSTPYPLDDVSRETPPRGRPRCPKVPLVLYRGEHIKYHKPTRVHPAFKERLVRFEEVVKQVSIEIYGRPPHKIRHLGTYNCRRIGGYPNLLSEHSFGNGIDIASFSFSRLKRGEKLPQGVPQSLKRAFRVDMLKHWNAKRIAKGLHQRFLHTLGHRLIESKIFRVLLGPAFPGHKNHFHLDNAPYELISIF